MPYGFGTLCGRVSPENGRSTPVSRNRIVHWRCLSGCVKIARSTWSCLVGASMTARRFDSVFGLAAADKGARFETRACHCFLRSDKRRVLVPNSQVFEKTVVGDLSFILGITASARGRTYVLMAREAFIEIRAEYQICKMMSAASFGWHWRAIESIAKLRQTISKSLSLTKTSEWERNPFGSPRTLRITFRTSPDADSLISYSFEGVMV